MNYLHMIMIIQIIGFWEILVGLWGLELKYSGSWSYISEGCYDIGNKYLYIL